MGIRRRPLALAAATLALLAAAPLAPAGAEERLTDLDLEELMQMNLNTMGITGIHHTHAEGEFMLGYSSMFMSMDGNRKGTRSESRADVLADYMVTPTKMDMQMHMLHLMYAPTDDLTLLVMSPYVLKSMEHLTGMGAHFTTRTQGFGDVELGGLFSPIRREEDRLITSLSLRLPTGSIGEKDDTPMGRVRLPYPMQLGSGSFELMPGLTYLRQQDRRSLGARASGVVRLNENSRDYRLGNEVELTAWGAYKLANWLSGSLRLRGRDWGNIDGHDDGLNPAMIPTADPDRRAGRRLDVLMGVNLFQTSGWLAGHRISVEGGLPVYQWLDGPQLETDWTLSVSWQWY